jgi:ketosteroid isomerase-like protein
MRLFAVLALSALLAGCGDSDAGKIVDASKDLRPHLEKVYAAWSTLDTTKVAPFYSKAPGAVFFDIAPLKYTGWDEYAAGFKKVSADWKSVKIDIGPDFRASSNGTVAWVTFTANFVTEMKDGTKQPGQARVTEVLQKDKDTWTILHEHVSSPMMEEPKPKPAPEKAKKRPVQRKARRR